MEWVLLVTALASKELAWKELTWKELVLLASAFNKTHSFQVSSFEANVNDDAHIGLLILYGVSRGIPEKFA